MITGLRYTNGDGRTFDFDRAGVYPSFPEAFDWELAVQELNGSVASYGRGSRELPVSVAFAGTVDPYAAMEELYEVCVADIAANREGRLSVGEWDLSCVLAKSAKDFWWRWRAPVSYELTFRSQLPYWTRDVTYQFLPPSRLGIGLDYPHDYMFDYGAASMSDVVTSESVYPCDFRLTVYGPASSPSVTVGGNEYAADVEVPVGGLLVVDSAAATVELVQQGGERESVLDRTPDAPAGSGQYIFEPIPPGDQRVSWDGGFGFDLVIYERRDERAWT